MPIHPEIDDRANNRNVIPVHPGDTVTDSAQTPNSEDGLSEDVAHRIIARAIELETRRAEAVSVAQLREVAQESGMSLRAFEEALREAHALAQAGPVPRPPRIWERVWQLARQDTRHSPSSVAAIPASGQIPRRSIVDLLAMNTIAFGAFWVAALILGRAGSAMTTSR